MRLAAPASAAWVVFALTTTVPGSASVSPGSPIQRAETLLESGDCEEAARLFADALTATPGDRSAMQGRVRALVRLDRWREALAEARTFHERLGTPGTAAILGEALVRAGRLSEARSVMEAVADSPDFGGRGLIAWARVLAAEGRASAETVAARAVEAAPEDRDVLARAAELTSDRGRTIELLGRYLDRSSGDDPDRVRAAGETRAFLEGIGDRRFWVREAGPERFELPLVPVPGEHGPAGYAIELVGGPKSKRVRVLLDTGSTGLFLVERGARRLGVETLDEQTVFGGGGDRRHANRRGVLPELAIGGLRFRDALVSTNPQPIHPTGAYHGVISLSAFEGYRVTLDFESRKLRLETAGEPLDGVPYWIVANQWLVEAGAGSARGLFLLDTGATTSIVAIGLVPDIEDGRLTGAAGGTAYGGAVRDARWLQGARLAFLDRQTPARPIRALDLTLRSRLGGLELGGYVGLDLLGTGRLVIDTTRRRVALEEAER